MPENLERAQHRAHTPLASEPTALFPSPELLEQLGNIHPELPMTVISEWKVRHARAYAYANHALLIGGILALALIGGFVYLVMNSHGYYAAMLLGAGAVSMVAGFRAARL
jgi:hypothetical protein